MGFPKQVEDLVLAKCQRCCCICHKFCGSHMELHHIKQDADGGDDTEENCIPLCFDCHADVKAYNPHHPKGHKYTENELKMHRNNWFGKVKNGGYVQNDALREIDIATYKKLKSLFDDEEYFLSQYDFASSSFSREWLKPLSEYVHLSNLPEYELFDADIEAAKSILRETVKKLNVSIAINTFPLSVDTSQQGVPEEWEYEQPERFDKVVKELNELSSDVWNKYCEFIRLARRRLAVE